MNLDFKLSIQCAKSIACLYEGLVAPNAVAVETDTEALIEEHHNGRWAIIFPGTSSGHDWLTNFKFRRVPWLAGGEVHRGFIEAFESVEHHFINVIPANAKLIIAGHSLGGALATLAARSLDWRFDVERVITFGSPRVGNGRFAADYSQRLGSRTARIVNEHDPVPFGPPWIMGNRHVETEIYLPEEGDAKIARRLETIALDRLGAVIHRFEDDPHQQLVNIRAHTIREYIARLEALA